MLLLAFYNKEDHSVSQKIFQLALQTTKEQE